MITYVNNVFVQNEPKQYKENDLKKSIGALVYMDLGSGHIDDLTKVNAIEGSANADDEIKAENQHKKIKIGVVQGVTTVRNTKGEVKEIPVIKWSPIINHADVKHITFTMQPDENATTEDTVTIDFGSSKENVLEAFAEGGKRIVVRLTFKDLPTRYRKWTESYEYVTEKGDDAEAIATALADSINKQWKRARVIASTDGEKLVLTAMKYTDDDSANSINWAAKVRFNANVYYTNPDNEGFESKNKYQLGATISKTPGYWYPGEGKLVRDREAQAMGYEGILNHGEGTWPIIQPAITADINKTYDCITIEFENLYRAADDIFRKTKECVEIYTTVNGMLLSQALRKWWNEKEIDAVGAPQKPNTPVEDDEQGEERG